MIFFVCGSSKGFRRSPVVETQRGQRAGSSSPTLGPIDGIGNFVGYSPQSPVRGQILLIVPATRGFGGPRWQDRGEEAEPLPHGAEVAIVNAPFLHFDARAKGTFSADQETLTDEFIISFFPLHCIIKLTLSLFPIVVGPIYFC